MPVILLLIGVVLIVSAFRDTTGQLGAALAKDVPGFLTWGGAIGGVGAIGMIPGLEKLGKPLVILVVLVIVLRNYANIIDGFKNALGQQHASVATPTPAEKYAANPNAPNIDAASIQGGGDANAFTPAVAVASVLRGLDPAAYTNAYGGRDGSGFGTGGDHG